MALVVVLGSAKVFNLFDFSEDVIERGLGVLGGLRRPRGALGAPLGWPWHPTEWSRIPPILLILGIIFIRCASSAIYPPGTFWDPSGTQPLLRTR